MRVVAVDHQNRDLLELGYQIQEITRNKLNKLLGSVKVKKVKVHLKPFAEVKNTKKAARVRVV